MGLWVKGTGKGTGTLLLIMAAGLGLTAQSDDLSMAIATINQARQAQGIQTLAWSADLASYATFWADQIGSGAQPFTHAQGQYRPQQGENLYEEGSTACGGSYDSPFQSAVATWMAQVSLYTNQPVQTGQEPWLHWSQCMWSQTTQIGCARAFGISEPYQFYVVCRFSPEGNVIGQKPF